MDGDQIGQRLELLMLSNDCHQAAALSRRVSSAIKQALTVLRRLGCNIIFAGGDNVLAQSDKKIDVARLPSEYDGITFSIGIGRTPQEALISLKHAKVSSRLAIDRMI